jgi:hypothetical protein
MSFRYEENKESESLLHGDCELACNAFQDYSSVFGDLIEVVYGCSETVGRSV